ncbi:MAG: transcriptional repressor [Pseudomonadota bacterium]
MRRRQEQIQAEVLTVLRQCGKSVSAYEILAKLRVDSPKMAPPTVYRALDALIGQGRVHRLESLNAFITSQYNAKKHTSILSICDDCGSVDESIAPDLMKKLSNFVGKTGFEPTRHVIEVHGYCASCGDHELAS